VEDQVSEPYKMGKINYDTRTTSVKHILFILAVKFD